MHCDFREGRAVGRAGFRVDGAGAGRALATAEDVGADNAEFVSVDAPSASDHAFPPTIGLLSLGALAGDMRVACQGVADENDVVHLVTDISADFIGDRHLGQYAAALEPESAFRQFQLERASLDEADGRTDVVALFRHGNIILQEEVARFSRN